MVKAVDGDVQRNMAADMRDAAACAARDDEQLTANDLATRDVHIADSDETADARDELSDGSGMDLQRVVVLLKERANALHVKAMGLKAHRDLRAANTNPKRPDDEELFKLDASLKRNTAVIRRLKQFSDDTKEGIRDVILQTNQSKYIAEVVAAFSQAQLKSKDIAAAVEICSLLHQRYGEISATLPAALSQVFVSLQAGKATMLRRRSILKLLLELLLVGVYDNDALLLSSVKPLAVFSGKGDLEALVANLALLAAFAHSGREEVMGGSDPLLEKSAHEQLMAAAKKFDESADESLKAALLHYRAACDELQHELDKRFVLEESKQKAFKAVVDAGFEAGAGALVQQHEHLLHIDARNLRVLTTRGDLPDDYAVEYESQRSMVEDLHRSLAALAESMQYEMPVLREAGMVTRLDSGGDGSAAAVQNGGADDGLSLLGAWDDAETRAFYESLPPLRELVPSVLLPPITETTAKHTTKDGAVEEQQDGVQAGDDVLEALPKDRDDAKEDGTAMSRASSGKTSSDGSVAGDADVANDAQQSGSSKAAQIEALMLKLPECLSVEDCDEWSLQFCFISSKAARRRAAQALTDVPRGSLQLLPYYSRIVATLCQVFPDIGQTVVAIVEEEFYHLLKRRDPTDKTLERRLRVTRFIGELAKHRVLPFGTLFTCFKALLDDFTQHNIDATCMLVETAGRFLYRHPDTKLRMANMLEVMMRLKGQKNLDARQQSMVDGAYFTCKLDTTARRSAQKRRTPLQLYVEHLLYERLDGDTIKDVLRKLRQLPWSDASVRHFLLNSFLKVVRVRFVCVPLIASLAAALGKYHNDFVIALVDCLLDEIRMGLESPATATYQQRVAHVKLFGEMYNYRLIDSALVFDVLQALMSIGYHSHDVILKIDPPNDFFRVRLVCTLLDTCGQYFVKGTARKRLDRFLLFFQRYVLAKDPVPTETQYLLEDTVARLCPEFAWASSFEEACDRVNAMLMQERLSPNTDDGASLRSVDAAQHAAAAVGHNAAAADPNRQANTAEGAPTSKEASASVQLQEPAADIAQATAPMHNVSTTAAPAAAVQEEAASVVAADGNAAAVNDDAIVADSTVTTADNQAADGKTDGIDADAHISVEDADDEFEKQLQSLLQEHQGQQAVVAMVRAERSMDVDGFGAAPSRADDAAVGNVAVRMLVKRGGKDATTKELNVPLTAAIAQQLQAKHSAEEEERTRIKQLVLAASKSQEQEAVQATAGSRYRGGGHGNQARKRSGHNQNHAVILQVTGIPQQPRLGHGQRGRGGGKRYSRSGGVVS